LQHEPVPQRGQTADLVLYNGKIITVDASFSIAQAVAIRGERFIAVGANDAVRASAGRTRSRST
jgi:predicted amidohydrolase YtcJ